MNDPTFEQEGNDGVLTFVTHFGEEQHIHFQKEDNELFRIGGTAISDILTLEGLVLKLPNLGDTKALFRAFRTSINYFEDHGILSPENWQDPADLHCYLIEYYPLNIEGQKPSWLISKKILEQPNFIYINVDILDGGSNLIKRYRVSPFFGDFKEITW